MTHYPFSTPRPAWQPVHAALAAFPIACFSLTVLTDIAYWRTLNLMWLHFSEWLLLAGVTFGTLALLVRALEYLIGGLRPSWPAVLGGVATLLLAAVNNFIHTADGWTAVIPYGLSLSVATVLAMLVTAWLARSGVRHV